MSKLWDSIDGVGYEGGIGEGSFFNGKKIFHVLGQLVEKNVFK